MKSNEQNILGEGPIIRGKVLGVLGTFILIIAWILVSYYGLIKPLYLPQPWRIFQAYKDIEPNIFIQAIATMTVIILGMTIGTLSGFIIGLLLRQSFIFRHIITPIIETWRPVPAVAIIPFFILWFGFSFTGKIILVSFGAFLIIVVGVTDSIDKLNPIFLQTALSFGASNWKFLKYCALPAILPNMVAPMRIALAVTVTLAVVSEFMGATIGLGHVIQMALNNFSTHTILLCTIILGLIGAAFDFALRISIDRLTFWTKELNEAIMVKK